MQWEDDKSNAMPIQKPLALYPKGRISCKTSILSGGSGLTLSSCGASEKPDLYLEKKHFGTAIVIGSQSAFKWAV